METATTDPTPVPKPCPISERFRENAVALRVSEAEVRRTGRRIEVVAIEAGMSKNKRLYTAEVLKAAVEAGKFNRIPVYANHPMGFDASHDVNAILGELVSARWSEADQAVLGEVEFLSGESARKVREVMAEKPHLLHVSIFAEAFYEAVRDDDGDVDHIKITEFVEVLSLDVVDFPGAKGRVTRVLEGAPPAPRREEFQVDESMVKLRVMEARQEAQKQSEAEMAKLREAHASEVAKLREALGETEKTRKETEERLTAIEESLKAKDEKVETLEKELDAERTRAAVAETASTVDARLADADLPEALARRVKEAFQGQAAKVEDIDKVIEAQKKLAEELGVPARRTVVGAGSPPESSGGSDTVVAKEAHAVAKSFDDYIARAMGFVPDPTDS